MMNLTLHIIIWAVLALIIVILALYRKKMDSKADDMIHVLDNEVSENAVQTEVSKKIEVIDRWGKILTALAAVYLVAIAGMYLYISFTQESTVRLG